MGREPVDEAMDIEEVLRECSPFLPCVRCILGVSTDLLSVRQERGRASTRDKVYMYTNGQNVYVRLHVSAHVRVYVPGRGVRMSPLCAIRRNKSRRTAALSWPGPYIVESVKHPRVLLLRAALHMCIYIYICISIYIYIGGGSDVS